MMRTNFKGIVLFTRPYREKDGLVKIFTEDQGTQMFFVRGFNQATHSLKSQLIPLTYNDYWGTINQEGMSFLQEARTLNFYRPIHEDIEKHAYGIYLAQLIDASINDRENHPELFALLQDALELMVKSTMYPVIATYVELFLLPYFGVHFDFHHCVVCHKPHYEMDFSMRLNGMLCSDHAHLDEMRWPLSPKVVYLLQVLSKVKLKQIRSIDVSDETLKMLRDFMSALYQEYVGIRLKSKSYLDKLQKYLT